MQKIKVKNFSLKHTLESGQVFRVEFYDEHYYFIVGDKVLKLKQEKNILYFSCSKKISKSFIRNLFGLEENYKAIIKSINKDKFISSAIKKSYGIRIIRQDPFECLVSYICSSNSSVKGVKRQVDNLSRRFGKKILFDGKMFWSFPENLGNIKELKSCGLGFRANYLHQAVSDIDRKGLVSLGKMPYEEARTELIRLKGIGPKVADCVLLYSLDFMQSFPIDRWIKRTMQKNYFCSKTISNRIIEDFARNYFGCYAGYAQIFLYQFRKF